MNSGERFQCVKRYSQLGSGRLRTKVFIATSEDARRAEFIWDTNVVKNQPCHKRICFANGKILDTETHSINGKRVYLFLWNFAIWDLYRRQRLLSIIMQQETSLPTLDGMAFRQIVREKAQTAQGSIEELLLGFSYRELLEIAGVLRLAIPEEVRL